MPNQSNCHIIENKTSLLNALLLNTKDYMLYKIKKILNKFISLKEKNKLSAL